MNIIIISPSESLNKEVGDLLCQRIKSDLFSTLSVTDSITNSTTASVPDEVILSLVKNKLISDTNNHSLVFYDFPRTLGHAKNLDEFMHSRRSPINFIISLILSDQILAERVRQDKTNDLNPYEMQGLRNSIKPITDYFKSRGKLIEISADGGIEKVVDIIERSIAVNI